MQTVEGLRYVKITGITVENFTTLGKTVAIDFFKVEIKMCHKVLCSHKYVVGKKKKKDINQGHCSAYQL